MISRTRSIAALSALALLAACGGKDDGQGTTISIQGKTEKGENASATADADGRVAINAPGMKLNVDLPKISLDADDMDIDGVKLYPGSKVVSVNIVGDGKDEGKQDRVQIVFDAPADPATVKTWFTEKMTAEKFAITSTAKGLSGKTDEGDPFSLDFDAGATSRTLGTLTVTG